MPEFKDIETQFWNPALYTILNETKKYAFGQTRKYSIHQ